MLRLDLNSSKQWEISILIAPNWQGKGIAKQALAWVKQQTQYHPLIAEVHPENKASQALFAVSGFIRHDSKWFHYP
jgi:RimJ/RimL family protein N-acetyltransferase